MRDMRRYRSLSAVVFAIAVSALVGGFFGRSALAIDDKVPEHYKTFSAALSAIETTYVDKVEADRLVYGAVRGMLGTLDPHSSFFDPRGSFTSSFGPHSAPSDFRKMIGSFGTGIPASAA